jgi:hypothetical protein
MFCVDSLVVDEIVHEVDGFGIFLIAISHVIIMSDLSDDICWHV